MLRETAQGLAARGWEIEILTTCARDHFTWANAYPAGVEEDGKLVVRRFETVVDTPRHDRQRIEAAILSGVDVDLRQQERWINDDLRVPGLYEHLLRRADDYRALVFAPYLFWTTFACAQVAPERTIIQPCLHDEPQAALEIFQPVINGARGIWALTGPELDLVERLFPAHGELALVGSGVNVPPSYDAAGFRRRHGIEGPFMLFGGRREGGKRWDWLLRVFEQLAPSLPFSLVTFGSGAVRVPPSLQGRVIDLGFLSEHDRDDAYAAADLYIQPSPYESFSRSIMESWLAGTPVIANADCEVVRWHCERSGAGLTFTDEHEFEQCLHLAAERPDIVAALGATGREYVLANYTWPDVLDRMEDSLDRWTSG